MIREKTVVFQSFFNLFSFESFENFAFEVEIDIVEFGEQIRLGCLLSYTTSISHEVIKIFYFQHKRFSNTANNFWVKCH